MTETNADEAQIVFFDASLSAFMASVTFTVPDTTDGLADFGFQFWGAGEERVRIVVDTLQGVYATHADEALRLGTASGFETAPGAQNTLQLLVDGNQALFGINGELVSAMELRGAPVDDRVNILIGLYAEDSVQDRVTEYQDFRVWDLNGGAPSNPDEKGAAAPDVEVLDLGDHLLAFTDEPRVGSV